MKQILEESQVICLHELYYHLKPTANYTRVQLAIIGQYGGCWQKMDPKQLHIVVVIYTPPQVN